MADALKKEFGVQDRPVGWGADLAPANRPGVPRERPSMVKDPYGPPLRRQTPTIPVNVSIEHRGLTRVFGESVAPRGLSGLMRNFAYRFGEGRNARWMTLLLADRVDVIENNLQDLTRGIFPNPFRERGWSADLKYDRAALVKRSAIYLGIGVAAFLLTRKIFSGRESSI